VAQPDGSGEFERTVGRRVVDEATLILADISVWVDHLGVTDAQLINSVLITPSTSAFIVLSRLQFTNLR
jgi:hypothetical protein